MKNYYNYGIDLGTTNSCVAKKREDDIVIFLNNEQMHVTPSAVHITSTGRKYVGKKGKEALKYDPNNVQTQFKRLMGTGEKLKFDNVDKEFSPEELSSEILKSLKSDVKRLDLEDEELKAAVITVPASFNFKQCNSTKKAAELAGIKDVLLLQEPIAASLAYGVRPKNKEQNWIVFDMGGGTLDIALVSNKHNRIETLNHIGDNFLGGKDIDRKIVDEIILPKIEQDYNLPDKKNNKIKSLYNKILFKAEEAKINLSNSEEAVIDLFKLGKDDNGKLIEGEITIKREELESSLMPIIKKFIPLIEKTLEEVNFSYDDIAKVLLVGGTTQIPLIRKTIKEETGLSLDYSLNPMTVVAKGAAIFASLNEREVKIDKSPFEEVKETANLKIEYNNKTSSKREIVIGKFDEKWAKSISEVKVTHNGGMWESGWFKLNEQNFFETEVLLRENSWNRFIVEARNDKGNEIELLNNIFSIRHDDNHTFVENLTLPHTISIEVNKSDTETALVPLIEKNVNLPAEANEIFEANKTLLPTKNNEFIAIKLWGGERFIHPQENELIGYLMIHSNKINKPIRIGDELEVKVNINRSRLIEVEVKILKNDIILSDVFEIGNGPIKKEDTFDQIKSMLDQCYDHLNEIKVYAYKLGEENIINFNQLMQELENMELKMEKVLDDKTIDADEKQKLYNQVIKLHQMITDYKVNVKKENGMKLKEQDEEFSKLLNETDEIVDEYGEEQDSEELNQIKKDYRYYKEFVDKNQEKESVLNRSLENLKSLHSKILFEQYDVWVSYYKYYKKGFSLGTIKFKNREKAEQTLKIAEKAQKEKDKEKLIRSVLTLSELVYKETSDESKIPPILPEIREKLK